MAQEDLTIGGKVLPITRWGTPVMHEVTKPVTEFDAHLHELIRDMFATMRAAQGVGLAATQVGVGISLFVYECPDDDDRIHRGVMCNPVLTLPDGKDRNLIAVEEGCLSFPGGYQTLARPDQATCIGQDEDGHRVTLEGTGYFARCLQHETDHLSGVVFGDRLSGRSRRQLTKKVDEVANLYPADWPVTAKAKAALPSSEGEH